MTTTLNTKTTETQTMRWMTGTTTSKTSTIWQNVSPAVTSPRCPSWNGVLAAEKEDDPEKALKAFRKIVDSETEKGEW